VITVSISVKTLMCQRISHKSPHAVPPDDLDAVWRYVQLTYKFHAFFTAQLSLCSFLVPMTRLHVELIDEILTLAVALGTIRANEASRICTRWRSFQRIVFRSITLDPFETDILDLTLAKHSHLTSYIEELRVIPRSVPCDRPYDYEQDLSPSFTNFLCNLKSPRVMIFYDGRIEWANLSLRSINSFLTVFQCDSFPPW
jgi:hypothetical protein